jgi:hypothetical protein
MRGRFPLRPAVAAMTAVAGLAGVVAFLPSAAAGQAPPRPEHAGPGTAAARAATARAGAYSAGVLRSMLKMCTSVAGSSVKPTWR